MHLYNNPELYSILRQPDPLFINQIRSIIKNHLQGSFKSIMDPACGPGDWLLDFAKNEKYVAGNDLSPEMCSFAKARLKDFGAEIIQGDMTALKFRTAAFDVALEVSGVLSELPPDLLLRHFRSVSHHLRPHGIYIFVLLCASSETNLKTPSVTFSSDWFQLLKKQVSINYQAISYNKTKNIIKMRRSIHSRTSETSEVFEDHYNLYLYSVEEIKQMIKDFASGLYLEQAINPEAENQPESIIETIFIVKKI